MKIVTIHQPEHLSYLGFFHKVRKADELVLLDNVKFEKNYFQNRNRIYTCNGEEYITVPVTNKNDIISRVFLSREWEIQKKRNCKKIELAYRNTPYWKEYGEWFLSVYTCYYETLEDLNVALLEFVLSVFGIGTNIVFAQSMKNAVGSKTDLLVNILKEREADKYIAGCSGCDYLELEKFGDIKVEFQNFKHPVYTQYCRTEFKPYMSVIDAIFNVGENIIEIIDKVNGNKI